MVTKIWKELRPVTLAEVLSGKLESSMKEGSFSLTLSSRVAYTIRKYKTADCMISFYSFQNGKQTAYARLANLEGGKHHG